MKRIEKKLKLLKTKNTAQFALRKCHFMTNLYSSFFFIKICSLHYDIKIW